MKTYSLLFLLIIISFYRCKDSNRLKNPLPQSEAIKLNSESLSLLESDPEQALLNFKKLAHHYRLSANRKELGTTQLIIANIYEENVNNLDSALHYATLSRINFHNTGETMQEAKLMNYIGLIKGKKGNIMGAFKDINKSKEIFNRLNFAQGIAAADLNLAQVFFEEKNYDQSLILYNHATQFWRQNGHQSQILSNNLFGIKLYQAMGDNEGADKLIEENKRIKSMLKMDK